MGATRRAEPTDLRVAFVGSYVPRRCGIATFTADTGARLLALMRDAAQRSACTIRVA